jgi:hypothetical protein
MGITAEEAQPTLRAVYPETVYEVGMLGSSSWDWLRRQCAREEDQQTH